MAGEIDTFGAYVRARLDGWGREFALHRDCEYLGHQSKNMLQVLIDHKGEMPSRATGFKPMEVNLDALAVERIVMAIGRDRAHVACALRGYYCASGRRKVERYHAALALMVAAGVRIRPTPKGYWELVKLGEAEVRASLRMAAMAA